MDADGVPDGWGQRLLDHADLDAAMEELAGLQGFGAEGRRGRIQSMRMHLREADRLLRRATALITPETAEQELLRHCGFCRENDLLLGRERAHFVPTPPPGGADQVTERILDFHRQLDAAELISRQELDAAEEIYEELLSRHDPGSSARAFAHIGLAVCASNRMEIMEASRHLEIAGLFVGSCSGLLIKTRLCARLHQIHGDLGNDADAAEWRATLGGLPCPDATKRAFIARGRLVSSRSSEARYVLAI